MAQQNKPQTIPPEKIRLRRLNIRLTQQEWDKVHRLSANTTCRSVSEYARKVLSEKPVKVFYRNKSFDAFEEQMIGLLSQLERFGENFEKTLKMLPLYGPRQNETTMQNLRDEKKDFITIVEEIRDHIEKLSNYASQNNALP